MDIDVWQLRDDLEFRWVSGVSGAEGYWVVKDPLAREWFCLSDAERQLLDLADGKRTVQEICRAAIEWIRPLETNFQAMASFFVQARRKGLLVAVGRRGAFDRQIVARNLSPRPSPLLGGINRLLAIRLPGINPNRILSRTVTTWSRGATQMAVGVFVLVMLTAMALIVSRFDVFTAELSLAYARSGSYWLIGLLLAVAIAKSIHELAHVAACRLVGAECREVGIMLLVGAPCLYCDVSDLWTVPRRGQRVFVSAAGMIAEVFLAGLATIYWAISASSVMHDLALVMIVVCSVATVLVNANPLLRYDGYFILADWIGVPNLSQRAIGTLCTRLRRLIWGTTLTDDTASDLHHSAVAASEPRGHRQGVGRGVETTGQGVGAGVGRQLHPSTLIFYAIASITYRCFVLAVISLMIYHVTVRVGAGWLGLGLVAMLIASLLLRALKPLLAAPQTLAGTFQATDSDRQQRTRPTPPRWWQVPRVVVVLLTVSLLFFVIGLIPLPSRVVIPMLFVASDQRDLIAAESGRLEFLLDAGTEVKAGEPVARLLNDDLQMELHQSQAEVALAESLLRAWQVRKGGASGNSTALLIAQRRLQVAQEDLKQTEKRAERLTIRAARDGRIFHAAVNVSADRRITDPGTAKKQRWSEGQFIPVGTLLGWVGHRTHRNALAMANQSNIDFIRPGQPVRVRHSSVPERQYRGEVQEIDLNAWKSIPPEFLIDGDGETTSDSKYLVRINFGDSEPFAVPLRCTAYAEIRVDARNLWSRLRRSISAEFRGL